MKTSLLDSIYEHNKFVQVLNTEVELPSRKRLDGRNPFAIVETVLRYGFAVRYSEETHSLQVRNEDYALVNELVNETVISLIGE